jgi:hypothetical protein
MNDGLARPPSRTVRVNRIRLEDPMRAFFRAVPVLLASLSLLLIALPRPVESVPLYAARTGLMCQTCHFDPNGGGPRNEFGFGFAKNRHLIAPEDSISRWSGLDVTNRVGETMPLYFGVNQRFMLLANQRLSADRPERLGFFNMENAIHLAFRPHDQLTLVYTLDGFATGPTNTVRSKEAFGMIGGLPVNGYLKAGRIRTPFGLRMDDHTVATRQGFGDFGTGGPFLPYDPRQTDMGVEVGAERAGWSGSAAFTNGQSSVFTSSGYAEAKTIKLAHNTARYQGGVSLYDDFQKSGTTPLARFTRWGYYGLTHHGPFALLGELAAGTDEDLAFGGKRNLMAGFVELDWAARRQYNLRVRYDRVVLDRGADSLTRDASTYHRYALEGEWVPVPFAELRWTVRYLDPRDPAQPDERQAYLQFHFAY